MKHVTFFQEYGILENIKSSDMSYSTNTVLHFIKTFFENNSITYETYSNIKNYDYKTLDYCYNNYSDKMSLLISKLTNRWYPTDVVQSLLYKDTISNYLSKYGFNELETKKINSIDDIGNFKNFIIKPRLGTGKSTQKSITTPKKNITPDIAYKKFNDIDHMLKFINDKQINNILSDGFYCIQEAIMTNKITQVSFHGTVNCQGNVYFARTLTRNYLDDNNSLTSRKFNVYKKQEEFIQNFVKEKEIKNTHFIFQCIVVGDKFYATDWNFRLISLTSRYYEIVNNPSEFIQLLSNMFDIPCINFYRNDDWLTTDYIKVDEFSGRNSWKVQNFNIVK